MDNSGYSAFVKKISVVWCMNTGEVAYLFQISSRACLTEFLKALTDSLVQNRAHLALMVQLAFRLKLTVKVYASL